VREISRQQQDATRATRMEAIANVATQHTAIGRRWVFTINNPVKNEIFGELPDGVRYVGWQREVGAEGTPHLQGYIAFVKPWRRARVCTLLGGACWLGLARGSDAQCIAYCTKSDTRNAGPWEFGNRCEERERTDLKPLHIAAAQVVAGKPLRDIDPGVFVKHANGLMKLSSIQPAPRRDTLQVVCIVGGTGIGKTHWVYEHFTDIFRPNYGNGGLWWDGYAGEDAVLLDEFRGQCPLQKLLMILDKYPLQLEVKGGYVAARFTKVFITTNSEPEVWYPNASNWNKQEFAALLRRLGRCDMTLYPETRASYIQAQDREGLIRQLTAVFPPPAAIVVDAPSPAEVPMLHLDELPPRPDTVPLDLDEDLGWHGGQQVFYSPHMCDSFP